MPASRKITGRIRSGLSADHTESSGPPGLAPRKPGAGTDAVDGESPDPNPDTPAGNIEPLFRQALTPAGVADCGNRPCVW